MALTGQLSDMSLAELIEFFCNQRKTGRLKVDYHHGHGVFFIKEGELVDAKVGSLTGAEAVYFALTLPNAAFDFSGEVEPPRRTIEESWKHVVLEGLRRLDEGISPRQSDAFGPDWSPSEADLALLMDRIERLDAGGDDEGAGATAKDSGASKDAARAQDASGVDAGREAGAPLSLMVESAGAGGGRKKLYVFGALAAVVLACAVASVPVARRMRAKSQPAPAAAPAVKTEAPQEASAEAPAPDAPAEAATDAASEDVTPQQADPAAAAALAARREREARERAARERRLEEARKGEAADRSGETATDAAKPAAPVVSGPKVVRVSVSYDEQGRVTQASVAGATPGAEAYGGTAVRIARGRRFPAGKPGGTVITIPVN